MKRIKIYAFFKISMYFLIFFVFFFNFFFFYKETRNFLEDEKELIKEECIEHQKSLLKNEVLRIIDYIDIQRDIKKRHSEGECQICDNEEEIQNDVILFMEKIRFEDEGYVFAGKFDGKGVTGPAKGKNNIDIRDRDGKYVVRDLIDIAKKGSGFYTYVMPNIDGQISLPKMSFVTSIPEWDWYIGSGKYIEIIDDDLLRLENRFNNRIKEFIVQITLIFIIIFCVIFFLISKLSSLVNSEIKLLSDFFAETSQTGEGMLEHDFRFYEIELLKNSANKMVSYRNSVEKSLIHNEKMISLGTMASGVAHEINNPLSGIIQSAQNIERRLSSEIPKNLSIYAKYGLISENVNKYLNEREIYKFIEDIKKTALKASIVIKDMLAFSRLSNERFELNDINSIIGESISVAVNEFNINNSEDFKKINFNINLNKNIPQIYVNKIEIEQVMINLIRNAGKALFKKNNSDMQISIKTFVELNSIIIEIEDNGIGIEKKNMNRIFEPFFTTGKTGEGTGLGLSISHTIINKKHKGNIEVFSKTGIGTKFRVSLPIN